MDPAEAAAFKKLWPCGQFPVLVDGGRTIPESTVIIEHLDAHYPGKTRFIPADPELARQVRLKDRFYDLHLHVHMQKMVGDQMRPDGKKDPHGVEQAKARMNVVARHDRRRDGRPDLGDGRRLHAGRLRRRSAAVLHRPDLQACRARTRTPPPISAA